MAQISKIFAVLTLLVSTVTSAVSQQYAGEVTGWLSGVSHKYNGDFNSDVWGAGGMLSLQYAPISRLGIEARVGLGEYRWNASKADLAGHPSYYGRGAKLGDNYPGTLTAIEPGNESRISTIDLLVNYAIVDRIPAVPFISAGVGMLNFAPSTSDAHDALPNNIFAKYSTTAVSIPIGGGVRIPISYRAGIVLRGEYRFVFSKYLDDVSYNGANDGITSVSLGFTYRFTNPPQRKCCHSSNRSCNGKHCVCTDAPPHNKSECPCLQSNSNDDEEQGLNGRNRQDNNGQDNNGQDNGDSNGQGGTSEPHKNSADAGTTTSTDTTVIATPTKPDTITEEIVPQNDSTNVLSPVEPCPEGLKRVCIDKDKSVCVDATFDVSQGRDRIRWEDAIVYDPSDPNHQKTIRASNKQTPYFANAFRQTKDAYYLCIECSFEREELGDSAIYNLITGTVVKGQGTFNPEECPECNKLAAEGR